VRNNARVYRLVLIDDHPVVREGLSALLSLESDLRVLGEAGTIEAGIEVVRTQQPDLTVCDLTMEGCTGGEAVRRLREAIPNVKVMVLSAHDSLECIRECFAAGAVGYVSKDALRIDLLAAVRRAANGERAVCRGVGETVLQNWLRELDPVASAPISPELTQQERRIIRMIALGVPTWRIAEELGRGVKVVEKQRASLMRRLNLSNAAAVTRYAIRCNLLSREEVDHLVSAE
jgi:DNA-binding NarL/FixJ family response regulator